MEDEETITGARRSSRVRTPVEIWTVPQDEPQLLPTPVATKTASTKKRPASGRSSSSNKSILSRKKAKLSSTRPSTTNVRKNPKRTAVAPKTLQDEEGHVVYIAAVNLQDIQTAQRSGKHPHCGTPLHRGIMQRKRLYLHTISSPAQRQIVYDRAAKSLQDIETALLPSYGGRRWKVQVTVSDPSSSFSNSNQLKNNEKNKKVQSPYFVFGTLQGALELAAWPQILSRIPEPPKFPGYYASAESKELAKQQQRKKKKQQERKQLREQQQQAKLQSYRSNTTSEDSLPKEQNEEHNSRLPPDDEEEDEEDDDDDDESLIVGVEDEEERSLILDLQEREVTPLSQLAYRERGRVPLPNISMKWISPLRECFYSRTAAWDQAVQLCKNEVWLTKVLQGYDTVRNRPLPTTMAPLPPKKVLEVGLLRFQRDGLWVVGQEDYWKDQQRCGDGEEDGTNHNNNGLRVTGRSLYIQCNRLKIQAQRLQELNSTQQQTLIQDKKGRATNTTSSMKHKCFTLRDADNELRATWKTLTAEEQEEWKRQAAVRQVDCDKRKTSSDSAEFRHSTTLAAASRTIASKLATPTQNQEAVRTVTPEQGNNNVVVVDEEGQEQTEPLTAQRKKTATVVSPGNGKCILEISYPSEKSSSSHTKSEPDQTKDLFARGHSSSSCGRVTPSSAEEELSCEDTSPSTTTVHTALGKPTKPSSAVASVNGSLYQPKPTTTIIKSPKKNTVRKNPAPWTKWCLNEEQVKLCYEAGMDHYDTVIATVKARDLLRELEDGFDVLRERGRGRFDMELPAFDEPAFSFLTNLSLAPWMPVVRQILGPDVVLIHKGMFLSMPGADAQVYHQDGPHLSTQTQRECHAVNVFVPLVDLTRKHGPTEFCLGTHILDQEGYRAKFAETPLVQAGTPILFDYRLGHKGLANTSGTCRPIVYCTYAKSVLGRGEFRDKVNFSRSRYHRIGDLVSLKQVPSREERLEKRQQRFIEQTIQRQQQK